MSSQSLPLIDVLIPVFNGESTIVSAIASIQQQSIRDLRIIVVDDGSTDQTGALLRTMAEADRRLVVITTVNRGIVDALNTALDASQAPYIARHDADDLAFPDRLQRQLDWLVDRPACVAIGANAFHIDEHGRRTGEVTSFKEVVVGDPFCVPSLEPYLMHPFLLVRRQALVDIGGYRYCFHSEDCDLYWRLAGVGALTNIVEPLGEYRIHAGSISAKSIVNGRISAINSQLAALSERRRRAGQADLAFDKDAIGGLQRAGTLRAMLDVAGAGLSVDERAYFEIATAAKLLELASYRPYRLADSDLDTIRRCIERNDHVLSVTNRRHLVFHVILGREQRRRSTRETIRLIPWKTMPRAAWQLVGRFNEKLRARAFRSA